MKKIAIIIEIVLILILISFAVMYGKEKITQKEIKPIELEKVTTRLAWLHQAQFAGMYVAKEKGFYRKEGLDVELKEFEFGIDQIAELREGKVKFSILSAEELLEAVGRGDNLVAVAAIYQTSPYAFASLKETGIKHPADLEGKVLGNEGANNEGRITYEFLLDKYGIPKEEVRFVNLNFDEVNDLRLKRADIIDLYRTDQPYLLQQAGLKFDLLLPDLYGFNMYGDVLVTTQDIKEKNPELVRRFVRATLAGWEYALKNVSEAVNLTLLYTDPEGNYHDQKYEEYILTQSIKLIRPRGNMSVGSMHYIPWNKSYNIMRSASLFESPFEVNSAYTTQFLK